MRPTLFDHAGGSRAMLALAEAHHRRCLADPELNHPFSHPENRPDHVARLAAYWGEVLGGPPAFSSGLGTHSAVLRRHACGLDLTPWGVRFLACFLGAMDDARLPDDPEFRGAMRAYMEWAIERYLEAMRGQPGDVAEAARVPRWGWSGLEAG